MSTINSHFTINYSQPEEYRLSHDSVFLARKVFDLVKCTDLLDFRVLDLCAGSGIVGMDLLFHLRAENLNVPKIIDFLEIQSVYLEHFTENVKRLGPLSAQLNFLNCNYNDLQSDNYKNNYDLIVCNPPYFLHGTGKLSPSEFKNRCRFYIDSDLPNLLMGIFNSLKPGGVCYILIKDLLQYKINMIESAMTICENKMRLEVIGDIRGTHFVQLTSLKQQ